jgi:hypothetical protein
MFHLFKQVSDMLFTTKPEKLCLTDFIEVRMVMDDNYNKKTNGSIRLCYFVITDASNNKLIHFGNKKDARRHIETICSKSIGYISYRIATGQIGLFFINSDYQNRNLGKQILI